MLEWRFRRLEAIVNRLAAALRKQNTPSRQRLQKPQDVTDLLQEQVNELRAETWIRPVEKARALGYLANVARKAIETSNLEARLEKLEANQNQKTPKTQP